MAAKNSNAKVINQTRSKDYKNSDDVSEMSENILNLSHAFRKSFDGLSEDLYESVAELRKLTDKYSGVAVDYAKKNPGRIIVGSVLLGLAAGALLPRRKAVTAAGVTLPRLAKAIRRRIEDAATTMDA